MSEDREAALVQGLLSGIAVFRWLAWGWLVAVLVVSNQELDRGRPWVAYGLAALALGASVATTLMLRRGRWDTLLTPPVIFAELTLAFLLAAGDELAYGDISHPQQLSSAWPLAGILTAGIALGLRGGMLAGVAVGLGRLAGDLSGGLPDGRAEIVSVVSTVVLYALAGGTAGFVASRLRSAEQRVSLAQAREEVARQLHDGVLQTLALVQRRASDPDVARLAHDQERELREFLFGTPGAVSGGGDLGARLRAAAARFEDRYDATAQVVVAPDLPPLSATVADALVGASTEALTNAGKHGGATTVTIYLGPDDTSGETEGTGESEAVLCSIKDNGTGFDPATTEERVGLSRSIRGRVADADGHVVLESRPGHGTEVRCHIPLG